jgi:hypothetical protein
VLKYHELSGRKLAVPNISRVPDNTVKCFELGQTAIELFQRARLPINGYPAIRGDSDPDVWLFRGTD